MQSISLSTTTSFPDGVAATSEGSFILRSSLNVWNEVGVPPLAVYATTPSLTLSVNTMSPSLSTATPVIPSRLLSAKRSAAVLPSGLNVLTPLRLLSATTMRPSRSTSIPTILAWSAAVPTSNDRACEPFGWNTCTFLWLSSPTTMRPDGPTATAAGLTNPPGGDSVDE